MTSIQTELLTIMCCGTFSVFHQLAQVNLLPQLGHWKTLIVCGGSFFLSLRDCCFPLSASLKHGLTVRHTYLLNEGNGMGQDNRQTHMVAMMRETC